MLPRDIFWTPWQGPGLEYVRLTQDDREIVADSVALGFAGATPWRLRYRITLDPVWNVRRVVLDRLDGSAPLLLEHDRAAQQWTDSQSGVMPDLAPVSDIDISATPFTNTLPIRRLNLQPGEEADLRVAYIPVPDLGVAVAGQRYTCLERTAHGARYRYEGLETGFTTELAVDEDGIVLDYPNLWRRALAP